MAALVSRRSKLSSTDYLLVFTPPEVSATPGAAVGLRYADGRRGTLTIKSRALDIQTVDQAKGFLPGSECKALGRKNAYKVSALFGQVARNIGRGTKDVFAGIDSSGGPGQLATETLGLGCGQSSSDPVKDRLDNGRPDGSVPYDDPFDRGEKGGGGWKVPGPPSDNGCSGGGTCLPPSNASLPKVGPDPEAGGVLRCDPGTWANSPSRFDYAWLRDGQQVQDSKTSSYTPGPQDLGHAVACRVTAVNRWGRLTATSEPFTPQLGAGGGGGVTLPGGLGSLGATGSRHGGHAR